MYWKKKFNTLFALQKRFGLCKMRARIKKSGAEGTVIYKNMGRYFIEITDNKKVRVEEHSRCEIKLFGQARGE